MASFNKYENFVEDLGKGVHQLHAAGHTLKVYLSNSAPTATDTVKPGTATEIASGNGYTTGGEDTQNDYSETGGIGTCVGTDIVWTCSSAPMATFRYAILYNSSASNALIGWWDYGVGGVSLAVGETFTLDFGASMFTIQ